MDIIDMPEQPKKAQEKTKEAEGETKAQGQGIE